MLLAGQVGIRRQMEALKRGLPDRHGFTGLGWDIHVEGACGELAVAKALGRYWNGSVNTFKVGGDVGAMQVRTRSRSHYELLIRPDDKDQDVFVLVTGTSPKFKVVGWIKGKDAKRVEWLQTHGGRPPAYFVPQKSLGNIEDLTEQME